MRIALLIFVSLISLAVCSKFKITQDYILSHKWAFNLFTSGIDTIVQPLKDGTFRRVSDQSILGFFRWQFNQAQQWLQIKDVRNSVYRLNTIIVSKNKIPQIMLIGTEIYVSQSSISPYDVLTYNQLKQYHEENTPYKMNQSMLTTVPWTISAGGKGGIHENVIFRNDGKVYQIDNKTLRSPQMTFSFQGVNSLVIYIDQTETAERYIITSIFANQNPFQARHLTLAGGQIFHYQKEPYKFPLKSMFLMEANISPVLVKKLFLTSKVWTINFYTEKGLHSEIILNSNGKVYGKDNKTEVVAQSHWQFNQDEQWLYIQFHPSSQTKWECTLNTIFVNDNMDLSSGSIFLGDYFGINFQSKEEFFSTCSLSIYSQTASSQISLQRGNDPLQSYI